jgi:hypothetical protein
MHPERRRCRVRWRSLGCVSARGVLLAVLLLLASAAAVAQPVGGGTFPPPSSQGLRAADGYQWLCAGAPGNCPDGHVPSRLRRPLRLPQLAAGTSCPAVRAHRVNPSFGIALGAGPAYPIPFRDSTLHYDHGQSAGGWIYVKVLWVIPPSYGGPVLIRGRQLDGTNWLGFDRGPRPLRELQIPPRASGLARAWRAFPSYTRVRAGAGCYAYQIDGTTFSRVLGFRLKP